MEITLNRKFKKENYTIGTITIDDEFICNSLEDKDYGFTKTTPESKIFETKKKHPKQVAIPSGRYEVSVEYYRGFATTHPWYNKTSCKGHIPCLVGVPGFSGILIHCGSNATHSAGCILVGYNTIKGGLTGTKDAFVKLCDRIMEANKNNEKIFINII